MRSKQKLILMNAQKTGVSVHMPTTYALKQSYLQYITTSPTIVCIKCWKQLKEIAHIFYMKEVICVGCFAKKQKSSQHYLLIDGAKKLHPKSRLSLQNELFLLRSIEMNGIDSKQLIQQELKRRLSENEIKESINSFFYKETEGSILLSSRNSQQETVNSNHHTKSNSKIKKLDQTTKAQLFIIKMQESQYKPSDYLLASLHQKSSQAEVKFLLDLKQKQLHELNSIRQRVELITKRDLFNPRNLDSFNRKFDNNKQWKQNKRRLEEQQEASQALMNKSLKEYHLFQELQLLKNPTSSSQKEKNIDLNDLMFLNPANIPFQQPQAQNTLNTAAPFKKKKKIRRLIKEQK